MKSAYYWMLLAFLIVSCTPLKMASVDDSQLPSLAAIGKKDRSLLHTDFKQVGEPHLEEAIAVSIQAVPFDKSTFKTYLNTKLKKGEKLPFRYVDSLPEKPKYFRFEIKDKIALKTLLNTKDNEEVRSYLTKDADCKIVTSISLYMDERQAEMYMNADGLFLSSSTENMLQLELVIGKKRTFANLPKNEIFDYQVTGFCWGEDTYGRPQIETLNDGKCPNGTEKNAQKLADLKPFLKI